VPETEEYGVSSMVYRARRPFHPHRLYTFLQQFFCFAKDWNNERDNRNVTTTNTKSNDNGKETSPYSRNPPTAPIEQHYGSILRSKGTCWIAGRDRYETTWAQTGKIIQLSPNSEQPWYCNIPPEEWPDDDDERSEIQARFYQNQPAESDDDDDDDKDPYPFGDRRQEVVLIGVNLQNDAVQKGLDDCLLTEPELQHYLPSMMPTGAYADPFLPEVMECHDPANLFFKARPGQDQHILVAPGFKLTLHSVALNVVEQEEDNNIRAVKVWLDPSDELSHHHGVLLASLRPDVCEQVATSIALMPPSEPEEGDQYPIRRIRVEAKTTRTRQESCSGVMANVEVHFVGSVEPLPYSSNHNGEPIEDQEDDVPNAMEEESDVEEG